MSASAQVPCSDAPLHARSVAYTESGDLWLGTDNGRAFVRRSSASHWQEAQLTSSPGVNARGSQQSIERIEFFDAFDGLIAGSLRTLTRACVLLTRDGGTSWQVVEFPSAWGHVRAVDLALGADSYALIATKQGTMVESHNRGASWTEMEHAPLAGIESVDLDGTRVALASRTALAYREEPHAEWSRLELPGGAEQAKPHRGSSPERVEVHWFGDALVLRHNDRLFVHELTEGALWTAIDTAGRPVFGLALSAGALRALVSPSKLLEFDAELRLRSRTELPLEFTGSVLRLAAQGSELALAEKLYLEHAS